VIQNDLGLSNIALGLAFSAFNYSYAPFQLVGGWIAVKGGFGQKAPERSQRLQQCQN
jgi:hypothetical protein